MFSIGIAVRRRRGLSSELPPVFVIAARDGFLRRPARGLRLRLAEGMRGNLLQFAAQRVSAIARIL